VIELNEIGELARNAQAGAILRAVARSSRCAAARVEASTLIAGGHAWSDCSAAQRISIDSDGGFG
jgi:hypothetical protein